MFTDPVDIDFHAGVTSTFVCILLNTDKDKYNYVQFKLKQKQTQNNSFLFDMIH